MTLNRWMAAVILFATIGTTTALAQPVQFKANVKMTDGSDGSISTGVMYFGGAKIRTELNKDGENVIMLIDPAARSMFILMPSEKMYMQMPLGQGPGSMFMAGPSDPTNPCGSGGNTNCVQGEAETLNGYQTIRWEYKSPQGVKTRAWISTRLRFPIKTIDDDGSSTEFTSIVEGPQPASLFAIPSDFTRMNFGPMGGRGGPGPTCGVLPTNEAGTPIR